MTERTNNEPSVAVIGAGIGGLAVAVRLARRGIGVTVFEAAGKPGGKVGEWRTGDFRFDTGPSLFTLPELVTELLDPDLHFPLVKLELLSRNFFEDGLVLDAPSDPGLFAASMAKATGVPKGRIAGYLAHAASVYDLTAPAFLFRSLQDLSSLLRRENIRYLWQWPRLKAFTSLHRFNAKRLVHKALVQMMDRYATYNGSDPYRTPATMAVIAHLENNLGAWLPRHGMYTIVDALVKQALRLGVEFRFESRVDQIVAGPDITGVVVGGRHYPFRTVISDIDIYHIYSRLLPDPGQLRRLMKTERSTSALIFYLGIKGSFPQLDVHNLFFSSDYPGEFRALFQGKTVPPDPTIYLYISCKINPADAPPGQENWFVMVNAPENNGQDWAALRVESRRVILQKLSNRLGVDIESRIVTEHWLDPVAIEAATGSWRGSLYGASSNSRFSAFARHGNVNSDYPGLYFTGGTVHPGGGIPLCMASAKIVDELIVKGGQR